MAVTSTIQFLHGLSTSTAWPTLSLLAGEPAFLTDTGKLYVGDGTNKILINPTYGTAADANTGTGAGNVPILDGGGKLDPSVIPSAFINNVYVVATVADLITLTDAQVGDIAVVTSTSETYALQTLPATTAGNWVKLLFNNAVLSVNGATGVVTLNGSNIDLTGYTGTQTGAIAATDTVNAAISKLSNEFTGYLPLTGGTITGPLTVNGVTDASGPATFQGIVDLGSKAAALTQPDGTSNTYVATTAFVQNAISGITPEGMVRSVNTIAPVSGNVTIGSSNILNTGYAIATTSAEVAATDTIAEALGKLQYQVININGGTF